MQDLIKQELFELEVLEKLNSKKFLNMLAFGGGTMLRLCWGLNRFSIDLDFRLIKKTDTKKLSKDLNSYLQKFYTLHDAADKFHTILFEIRSPQYPRALKIEIRKDFKKVRTEQAIAFSPHASTQVMVKSMVLEEMMKAKIDALIDRKEIRDAFDLEFLVKKGIAPAAPADLLKKALKTIENFTAKDYTVKLGSVLDAPQRKYYTNANFRILIAAVHDALREHPL